MAAYGSDINYSALIEEELKKGANADKEALAQLEEMRNSKILGEGLDYEQTNNYSQFLPNQQQNQGQYGGVSDAQNYLNNTPKYSNPYSDDISAIVNQILNNKYTPYDSSTDPIYGQYKETYTREGKRAMEDTVGQVSARTGGLASSYADSAGAGAYDYYMQQLADKIPELAQQDYSRYRDSVSDLYNQFGMYNTLDNTSYSRYRDDVSDYRYGQEYSDSASQREFENQRYDQQWQNTLSQQEISNNQLALENQRYDTEYGDSRTDQEFSKAATLLNMGFSTAQIASQLGITEEQAAAYVKRITTKTSSGGGGGSTPQTGIVEKMLSYGNDTNAYEYLISLGLSQGKTEQLWELYQQGNNPYDYTGPTSESNPEEVQTVKAEAFERREFKGEDDQGLANFLASMAQAGRITEEEAIKIAQELGIQF